MVARQIALKKVPLDGISADGQSGEFDYAEMLIMILRSPAAGGQGLSLDDVLAALPALDAVEKAKAAGADEVILTDEQWVLLRDKLTGFRFAIVHRAIADFGTAIRLAPEIGTEPKLKAVAD